MTEVRGHPAPSRASHTKPIIELRDLVKTYKGFTAVNGINLTVNEGEIFGILGPNGAGKTTTLEMIEGLRTPDGGTIMVDGLDGVKENEQVRRIIGVQLQSTALFPYLNARELIELFGSMYDVRNPGDRATDLLEMVNLADKASSRVEELSGGQQQRLSIALALVNTPRITFLDEPTTGLDPQARRQLWQTILDVRDSGTTVVITTHYMDEAEVLCDRIAILDHGEVIACDTPGELIRNLPQDAVVSATVLAKGATAPNEDEIAALPGVEQATVIATDAGCDIRAQTSNTQATIVALIRLAEERDIPLQNLGSTRATLEDVFLTLTGREYDRQDEDHPDEPEHKPKRRRFGRRQS